MKSIDWDSIFHQSGPLEPPKYPGFGWNPREHKHRLKIAEPTSKPLEYTMVFLCQGCDFVMVCRRVLIRHMVLGNVGWISGDDPEGDVVYRTWYSEGEPHAIPRNT